MHFQREKERGAGSEKDSLKKGRRDGMERIR